MYTPKMLIPELQYQIDLLKEEKQSVSHSYHADYDFGISLLEKSIEKQNKMLAELEKEQAQIFKDYNCWLKS